MKDNVQSISVVKETFFNKIKKYFNNLFFKGKEKETISDLKSDIVQYENKQKEEFTKNIKVEEDKEKQRLTKLQSMLRNKEIDEKEISKEDELKLRKLYEIQINNLKKTIEEHRKAIVKIKSKLETNKA